MVSITCHGGVGEIGGNKILVEDGDTRIFIDFGMSFGRRGMFFEEYLKPRAANGIVDLLFTGLVPELEGVYRKDLLKHAGMKVHDYPSVDAVMLSHPHADHANYISFLDEDIPVYCGETALHVLKGVQGAGMRDIEREIVNFKRRPLMKKDYRNPPVEREFRTFRTGNKIKIGNMEIVPVHVDHSVPGAYGFVIHCSDSTIAYTGDLRMHGTRAGMTEDFIAKAADEKPDILLTEGTRVGQDRDQSEAMVQEECDRIIDSSRGLNIADFNFKDTDRFKTFYNIAKKQGRKLAISARDAVMLKHLADDAKAEVPLLKDGSIVLFKHKAASGTYSDEDYQTYEREVFSTPGITIIDAEEIRDHPNEYIFVGGFYSINDMIDVRPEKCTYIYSHSEPFNEEMAMDFDRLQNWIRLFGMDFRQSHCSGHANWADMKEMIKRIDAKLIVPIHTEKPEAFAELGKIKLVRQGERFQKI